MRLTILIISIFMISVSIHSQTSQLTNGFYRTSNIDSCQNSKDYIHIYDQDKEYCIFKTPFITDRNFESIQFDKDTLEGQEVFVVGIKLDSSGASLVSEATEKMIGQRAVFIIDGKVAAAPVVRDPITSGHIAVFCDEKTVEEVKRALKIN